MNLLKGGCESELEVSKEETKAAKISLKVFNIPVH